MTSDPSCDLATAYEDAEDPASFPDRASLDRYRSALLDRTVPQVDWLARRIPPAASVVEIGCGSGRLLIELARRHAIDRGLGLDLAASRINFATQWAFEANVVGLRFVAADALTYDLPQSAFDVACCITGAFAYFDALESGGGLRLALHLKEALRPQGLLCLEVYPHPGYRRLLDAAGAGVRVWTELSPDDPWRYYLSELSLDERNDVLTHQKTFIHRTTGLVDTGRQERLHLYTPETLTKLLTEAEFDEIQIYDGWTFESYAGGEIMVITAIKPSPT